MATQPPDPGVDPLVPALDSPDPRARLLAGITVAVAAKGYAATTIADIARAASTSKRTFYEYFLDKEECFLACYDAAADGVLRAIAAAGDTEPDVRRQIPATTAAYLRALASAPDFTHAFMIDVLAAGPRALAHRRAVNRRFAAQLIERVQRARAALPGPPALHPDRAMAVIGAINELVLQAVEDGATATLERDLGESAAAVIAALLGVEEAGRRG